MPSRAPSHRPRGAILAAVAIHNPRLTAAQRGYGARWRKASRAYLDAHPLCECKECQQLPLPLPADVVDHRKPHKGDQGLFWDQDNWQAMAKTCHDRKTAKEDGGFGHEPSPHAGAQ